MRPVHDVDVTPPDGMVALVADTDRPGPWNFDALAPHVERTFVFLDLSSFSEFMDEHGEHAAAEALTVMRELVREVCVLRGVRVAKWLGDGAMLVSVSPAPAVAAAVELVGRYEYLMPRARAGVAAGGALLFEADDYVGRPVNLAARLVAAAGPGEVLAHRRTLAELPAWVAAAEVRRMTLKGFGRLSGLWRLRPDEATMACLAPPPGGYTARRWDAGGLGCRPTAT